MHVRIEKMFLQLFLSKYCYVVWQKMGVLERECFQPINNDFVASYWNSWQRGRELAVHCFVHSTIAKKFHIQYQNKKKVICTTHATHTRPRQRQSIASWACVCDEGTCDGCMRVCICKNICVQCNRTPTNEWPKNRPARKRKNVPAWRTSSFERFCPIAIYNVLGVVNKKKGGDATPIHSTLPGLPQHVGT